MLTELTKPVVRASRNVHDLIMVTAHLPETGSPARPIGGDSAGPPGHRDQGNQDPGNQDPGYQDPGNQDVALRQLVHDHDGLWIGASHPADASEAGARRRPAPPGLLAVPLTATEITGYDVGMSQASLWPLYHGAVTRPTFRRAWWSSYVEVNRRFADAVRHRVAPGGTVWVRDFRLQLVPRMLRRTRPDLTIGFTSQIPFPSVELFAQLPWRRQLLEGLAGADLIGLPRPSHVENLLLAARRYGVRATTFALATRRENQEQPARGPQASGRVTQVTVLPACVDAPGLARAARSAGAAARARALRAEVGNPATVLLGVDSLDDTRGILHRLDAIGELLSDGRLDPSDTAYVQVAVPPRHGTGGDLRQQVEAASARINGTHARIGRPVVHYVHRTLPAPELTALYLAADALLTTPLSDGTSLSAKEYVATRHDGHGMLVLSEFTGTADELPEALIVNPHDQEALQDVIARAAAMPSADAARRMAAMRRRLLAQDCRRSALNFLDVLAG